MQLWIVLVLVAFPLAAHGDVSHLGLGQGENEGGEPAKEQQDPSSGFYPSTGLPLPPGYAIPTGANFQPSQVQPPNFPLPIYPPFFGFGGGEAGPGLVPGPGAVPSAYPNGGAGGFPTNAAIQQPGFGAPEGAGFPGQGGGFPGPVGAYPGQGAGFPPQGAGFPPQGAGFPPQGAGFPPQGAGFPQGAPFPGQGGSFPGQGGAFAGQGGAFPGQGAAFPQGPPFPGQGGPFPGQGAPFPGQGAPFPGQGGPFPGQGGPFPGQGAPFPPPEFLYNQGLPVANAPGSFQPPGFNVPAGFGGPIGPGQQFPPGFGGSAPPGYSDEPQKDEETPKPIEISVAADDPKSGADTVYATNGGYVYQKAK